MKTTRGILSAILLLALPYLLPAQYEQVFVGARPMALGEAYTALANDGLSLRWNPAGLAHLSFFQFNTMYCKLHQISGLSQYYANLAYAFDLPGQAEVRSGKWLPGSFGKFRRKVLPHLSGAALALDCSYIGFDDEELNWQMTHASAGFGIELWEQIAIGGAFKYLRNNVGLDHDEIATGYAFGYDLGLQWRPINFMTIGMVFRDVSNTRMNFNYNDGHQANDKILSQNLRVGLAFQPRWKIEKLYASHLTLAVEADRQLRLGAEILFNKRLWLRGGFQREFKSGKLFGFSSGIGLKLREWQVHWACTNIGPTMLSPTHWFSLQFALQRPRIIRQTNFNSPLASQYRRFKTKKVALGKILLFNKFRQAVRCKLNISSVHFLKTPVDSMFTIESGKSQNITVEIDSDSFFKLTQGRDESYQVELDYEYRGQARHEAVEAKSPLYPVNALDWAQPENMNNLIDHGSKTLRQLANMVRQTMNAMDNSKALPPLNLWCALISYEVLRSAGFSYLSDAKSPFRKILKNRATIDQIVMPENIALDRPEHKKLDLDDLTLLYLSVLNAFRIPTAVLIDSSKLVVLTEVGAGRDSLLYGEFSKFLVRYQQRLYAPTDLSAIDKKHYFENLAGFEKSSGADTVLMQIVPVKLQLPDSLATLPDSLLECCELQFEEYKAKLEDSEKKMETELEIRPLAFELINSQAVLQAWQNRDHKAISALEYLVKIDPENAAALNNLGILSMMAENYRQSLDHFRDAVEHKPHNQQIYLNLAVLYSELACCTGDSTELDKYITSMIECLNWKEAGATQSAASQIISVDKSTDPLLSEIVPLTERFRIRIRLNEILKLNRPTKENVNSFLNYLENDKQLSRSAILQTLWWSY